MAKSKRQQIVEAIEGRLKAIKKSDGYETDLGLNVIGWKEDALQVDDLPALVYRDVSAERIEGVIGRATWQLRVAIDIYVTGSDIPTELRKGIQDIFAVLYEDYTLGGLAHRLTFEMPDTIEIERQEVGAGLATVQVGVVYDTALGVLGENSCIL